jgi:hypothetical protein
MKLRVVVLAVGAVIAACSPPPMMQKCRGAGGFGGGPGGIDNGFFVAGDELSITLLLPIFCESTVDVKATVSVVDPSNDALPLSFGEAERQVPEGDRDPNVGMKTVVKVLSTTAGSYHFVARFEPNLGLFQTDVLVAENHTNATPDFAVSGSGGLTGCDHIDVSPLGRPLCLSDRQVRSYELDGGPLQTLTLAGQGARFGSVVWTLEGGNRVQRWEETDAGFVWAVDGGLAVPPQSSLLAPAVDDLILVGITEIQRVVWDGGSLSYERLNDYFQNNSFAAWRDGPRYMTYDQMGQQCSAAIGDGGRCLTPFFSSTGFGFPGALGNEPGAGIWIPSDNFSVFPATRNLSLLRFSGGATDLSLPPSWDVADAGTKRWDTGTYLQKVGSTQKLLVLEKNGAFTLQSFRGDLGLLSETGSWASFHEASTNRVLIYKR